MTHSRKTMAAGAFILTFFLAQACFAGPPLLGEPESTVKLTSQKLWRGIVNTATGVGELIRQPILCTREEGVAGIPVGLFNGVSMSVLRTGAGLLEVATFPWILDETTGYGSLLNPDYVWQLAD
jgi:putative exosortase-associated protein (TIGR04073 family)